MPGNTASVSRDSFDFSKFYDSVRLQDGVPIMDSDWNEFEDIRRINDMLTFIYGFGRNLQFLNSSGYAGFGPYGNDQSNDFVLRGGAALVEGVLVLTSADDPPAEFDYDSTDNFYSDCGVVTAVASGNITDDYKYWTRLGSFGDALIPSVYQGGARVVMTSGAENGNTFTVTAVPNNTSLTLSGGTGSIAPGDTYIVLPPALTTPGGSRTDEVFLMVWFEDIASEEHTDLEHPAVGIETCHRWRRRWAVRVSEGGTTPTNSSSIHGFNIRYLKIGEIARTATATISAASVSQETDLHVSNHYDHITDELVHGVSGDYTANIPTALNSGGIGTGYTSLEEIFDGIDASVIRRRSFTAVFTDGSDSTGGDFNSAYSLANIYDGLENGTFFARRGTYYWPDTDMSAGDAGTVIGEYRGNTFLHIHYSNPTSNLKIFGNFYNCWVGTNHATYMYEVTKGISGDRMVPTKFEDCTVESGSLLWSGGPLYMKNCTVMSGMYAQSSYGLCINQASTWQDHTGVFENVIFEGLSDYASTGLDTVFISGLDSVSDRERSGIKFTKCEFKRSSTQRHALRIEDCLEVPIIFEDCLFYGNTDASSCSIPLLYIDNSSKIVFRNCQFSSMGPILDVRDSGVVFENCTFEDGSTSYSGQIFTCHGGITTEYPAVFKNCQIHLRGGGFSNTGTLPAIEFGGRGGTAYCDSIFVDGLNITFDSSTPIHRFTPVKFYGTTASDGMAVYNNVVVDVNGAYSTINRTIYGTWTVASIVEMVAGTSYSPIEATNFKIIGVSNPDITGDNDDSMVFVGQNCNIHGLEIDGTGTNSDSMGQNATYGLIYFADYCKVNNLTLFKTNEVITTAGSHLITLGNNADLLNSNFEDVPSTAISSFVNIRGIYSRCCGNKFILYTSGDQGFKVISSLSGTSANSLDVSNNIIRRGINTGSEHYINLHLADGCRVVNNVIRCTSLPSDDIAIYCTGDGTIVDGNAVLTEEATTPLVTNSGTGSVTGDNVLMASYTP